MAAAAAAAADCKLADPLDKFRKTLLLLGTMSASGVIGLIKSLSGLSYYWRKSGELLLKAAIRGLDEEKVFRIIRWLSACDHSLGLAFYGKYLSVDRRSMGRIVRDIPIGGDHTENLEPWSTAYKRGERFYSPMGMVCYYIRYMWQYAGNRYGHCDTSGPIFKPSEWKDQAGDMTIEKIVALIIQSCEAGNPDAIEMYIRYLQHDRKDYGSARVYIARYVSLGELDLFSESSNPDALYQTYFDDSELVSMETTNSIVESVVALYCSVEDLLAREVIQRHNEITERKMVVGQYGDEEEESYRVMAKFTKHYDLLLSTLGSILNHHGQNVVPLLINHLSNKLVFPIVSFLLATHASISSNAAAALADEKETRPPYRFTYDYLIKDDGKAYEYLIKSAQTGYQPSLAYLTCDPESDCSERQRAVHHRFLKDLGSIRV
ncbi:MAG: hypothetical protein Hyperionvirus1_110 [Hyperionvirus sp.]|uniref:Uncharacterized protein n=1 Tax=Hyperionvirus sp. TaxID=2487770 RepID=A0A3G5A8M1_9VIRU|nr:MAG: hypothetical protein Hyperionvirus1_110 [Hyperionvirus sp.]